MPRSLEQNDVLSDDEDEGSPPVDDHPTMVICSGELVEQVRDFGLGCIAGVID